MSVPDPDEAMDAHVEEPIDDTDFDLNNANEVDDEFVGQPMISPVPPAENGEFMLVVAIHLFFFCHEISTHFSAFQVLSYKNSLPCGLLCIMLLIPCRLIWRLFDLVIQVISASSHQIFYDGNGKFSNARLLF